MKRSYCLTMYVSNIVNFCPKSLAWLGLRMSLPMRLPCDCLIGRFGLRSVAFRKGVSGSFNICYKVIFPLPTSEFLLLKGICANLHYKGKMVSRDHDYRLWKTKKYIENKNKRIYKKLTKQYKENNLKLINLAMLCCSVDKATMTLSLKKWPSNTLST